MSNWTVEKMVTEERAARVARSLFPSEFHDGSDCRNERENEGNPCRICAEMFDTWTKRVAEVRKAMMEAFS